MKKLIFYSIAIMLLLSSCEDLLTKNLELEEFNFEKQMVISGNLISTEDEFRLLISENQAITDPLDEWSPLQEAQASLYRDDELLGDLSFESESGIEVEPNEGEEGIDSLFVLDLENIDIIPGDYRIEISHPDYSQTVVASSTLPENVPLSEIEFEADFGIAPNFFQRTDAVHITFTDPPEDNYYRFDIQTDSVKLDTFIFETDTTIFESFVGVTIDTNEPNASFSQGKIIFNDDFFNGQEHTITFYVTDFSEDGIEDILDILAIDWEVLSEEQFEFTQSLDLYFDSQSFGPFSEAVSIFNNVEGGIGIFSTFNRTNYKIE